MGPVHIVDTLLRSAVVPARARRSAVLIATAVVLAIASPGLVAAGTASVIECGQIVAYTEPDPGAPADGSLTIGLLPAWTIAADAVIGASATSILPSFAGSGPSCIELELGVDDRVTGLDFAPEGSITGAVVYDSGTDFYVFADRLLVPTFITDAYPGLAAVFATSAVAGTPVSSTFTVDVTSGAFTGVAASASFCGHASLDGDGDGQVGEAIIPAAVLDPQSAGRLERANGRVRCADVETQGTVGNGLDLTTTVDITGFGPDASPPDTAAMPGPTQTQATDSGFPVWLVALLCAAAVVGLTRRQVPARGARLAGQRPPMD